MNFSSKQIVTMVVAVCAAAVLTPVAVGAATGTLTNIIDPVTSSRQARVTSNGALATAQHPGVPSTAFNGQLGRLGLGWSFLNTSVYPSRLAVTDMTLTAESVNPGVAYVWIEGWVRKASVGSCTSPNTTDFVRTPLRRVAVTVGTTVQVAFAGLPLIVPAASSAGVYSCFGVTVASAPASTSLYTGYAAYRYTP